MLLSWLSLALVVIFILLSIIAFQYWHDFLGSIFSVAAICSIILTVVCFIEVTARPDVEYLMHKYSIVLKEINEYNSSTDFELKARLLDECKNFDKIIIKHNNRYSSIWRGRGYSKDIGELPLLTEIFLDKFN